MTIQQKTLLDRLLRKFNVTNEEFSKHSDFYNNHFECYGNEIYDDVKTRLVHLVNFWDKGNPFNQRYDFLEKKICDFKEVIEFGFGLPYLQITNVPDRQKFIYVDKYKSAEVTSKEILGFFEKDAVFVTADIEEDKTFEDLKMYLNKTSEKLFVAIETIEHLKRSRIFWRNLKKYSGEYFFGSLPVGPAIPSHELVLLSQEDAADYFSDYIDIEESKAITFDNTYDSLSEYKIFAVFGKIK